MKLESLKPHERRNLLIFAMSSLVYFPFSLWITTTRIGSTLFLFIGHAVYVFPMICVGIATPFLLFGCFFKKARQTSFFWMVFLAILVPCVVMGVRFGHRIRMEGIKAFVERSQPLVDAIRQFETDNSVPPTSLNDLVPQYLDEVPQTGMMAYPDYDYHTGDETQDSYQGNAWVLSVFTPSGFLNFDKVLYFPKQNYPQTGYGGSLEPIIDWAYVHE